MTIDKEKLKALAQAQSVQVWTRTRGRRPGVKGQPLMYGVEGPEGVSDYDDWGFTGKAADYIAAACPATVLVLLAEIERHEAWRTAFLDERDAQMRQRDQLRAENEALRKALLEASEEVATWGAYASEYFQEKHDLAGCVAKLHAAAMAKEASHD